MKMFISKRSVARSSLSLVVLALSLNANAMEQSEKQSQKLEEILPPARTKPIVTMTELGGTKSVKRDHFITEIYEETVVSHRDIKTEHMTRQSELDVPKCEKIPADKPEDPKWVAVEAGKDGGSKEATEPEKRVFLGEKSTVTICQIEGVTKEEVTTVRRWKIEKNWSTFKKDALECKAEQKISK